MKYLFVHQNFPGQFVHLLRHLTAQQRHDILFISEDNANRIEGVRRALYAMPKNQGAATFGAAFDFEQAQLRAHGVALIGAEMKRLGFEPDIVIGHHGWGELLNLQDVWPDTPLLGYHEFYYRLQGQDVGFDPEFPTAVGTHARIRAKNAVNHLALTNPGYGHTPTLFQKRTYPDWAQDRIAHLPEGVDLERCVPDPGARKRVFALGDVRITPRQRLVTYVARDLEPYRGFNTMMRALPEVLDRNPDAQVILVGGSGVSYGARLAHGSWRDFMVAELGDRLDLSRIHFVGKLAYDDYRRLLQRSDAHVYLTYPFVLSWSLREALAMGCAVIGSDTEPLQEFVTHGENGLLTPFTRPDLLAEKILTVLDDRRFARRLGESARGFAEATLRMEDYLAGYERLIDDVVCRRVPQ